MNTRIEVGDIVNVYFEHVDTLFDVEVTHKPSDVGDSWYFTSTVDTDYGQTVGQGHAVILYSRMDCIKKAEESKCYI